MKRPLRDSWSRIASASAALIVVVALLAPCAARATPYVVKLKQQDKNVVAIGNGEFDLTGLTFWVHGGSSQAYVTPFTADVDIGPAAAALDGYTGFSCPTAFGTGTATFATNSSGDVVFLTGSSESYGFPVFAVPQGYISGTALSSSAFWNNASAASLGITPGKYTWTWGSAADQSFTLEAFMAVPEPAALGMFGLGLLLLGGFLTLRGRQAGNAC